MNETKSFELTSTDVQNAIHYRITYLQGEIAKAMERLPEESERFTGLTAELIKYANMNKEIKRGATYTVSKKNEVGESSND